MKQIGYLLSIGLLIGCTEQVAKSKADDGLVRDDLIAVEPFVLQACEVIEKNPYGSQFEAYHHEDVDVPKLGKVAAVAFIGRNFIPDQKLTLASYNIYGIVRPIYELQADDDGYLGRQVPEGTMMLENEVLLMFDFFRGQPIRYLLYSSDGKVLLSSLFVPYPIETTGKDGAKVSLRRLTYDGRLMFCEGVDFQPDEVIKVTSQAAGIIVQDTVVVCENGVFTMVFEPGATGKTGGKAIVEIRRARERLFLEYDWGSEAINPKKRLAIEKYTSQDTMANLSQESARDTSKQGL